MAHRKRAKGTRAPNGESSIYYSVYDGYWHGRVTVGVNDNGHPDRRHIRRKAIGEDDQKAYNAVLDAVRKLERERHAGTVRKAGKPWTVERWLTHWVETIAAPSLRYKAASTYRSAVYVHLIPNLGAHRIDKITPEHFERMYAKILKPRGNLKATSVGMIHRTAITAFGEAVRRGHVQKNPVELAKPPKAEEVEVQPFTTEEIQQLITTALTQRNGVRFVLALALGTRQGESIGLKWSRLDLNTRTLQIARQLQRHSWQHGCDDPHACGASLHKVKPCKPDCRHKRACPPPCPPNCTSHARSCPQRHGGGLVEVDVKSSAGRRGITLPDQLYELLVEHKAQQDREREHAGTVWEDGGWMFAQENGRPIDPTYDRKDWKALLARAGVRDARLHDARHTAATVLLVLGVPERAVMAFMGWSNGAMAKRYQHITAPLQQDIASRIDGYLWKDKRDRE